MHARGARLSDVVGDFGKRLRGRKAYAARYAGLLKHGRAHFAPVSFQVPVRERGRTDKGFVDRILFDFDGMFAQNGHDTRREVSIKLEI